jgi:hypothetical protein
MAKIRIIGKNGRELLFDKKDISYIEIPYVQNYLKVIINMQKGLKRQIKKIKQFKN